MMVMMITVTAMMIITVTSMMMTFAAMIIAAMILGKCRIRPHHLRHDWNGGHCTDCPEVSCQDRTACYLFYGC